MTDSFDQERRDIQRRRRKNLALFFVLLAMAAIFYFVTLIRMEQTPHQPREIGGIKPNEPAPSIVTPPSQ